ncbi:CLUMA_CG014973, isoform A [Clunio marinus]|uniref:CLUMA_CG014973, isoform A n=1 Tax=Clunio marinus TaxID=568069 RepID=A0A1J1INF0_9DIPT|nr:CLUMA_CG014973, isoform A [Clunio marinus]
MTKNFRQPCQNLAHWRVWETSVEIFHSSIKSNYLKLSSASSLMKSALDNQTTASRSECNQINKKQKADIFCFSLLNVYSHVINFRLEIQIVQ